MDKYTVDLDKVLNDFEYSELADNFTASKGYHSQTSSNYASSSKSKSGDAKHSITKVFHSLNEYLNTDISSANTAKINLDNNKENYLVSTNNNSFLQSTTSKNISCVDSSLDSAYIDNKLKELELNVSESELIGDIGSDKTNDKLNTVDTLLDLSSEEIHVNDSKGFLNQKNSDKIESLLDLDGIDLDSASFNEKQNGIANVYTPSCSDNTNAKNSTQINTFEPIENHEKVSDDKNLKECIIPDDSTKEISENEKNKEDKDNFTDNLAESYSDVAKIETPEIIENTDDKVEEISVENQREIEVMPKQSTKDVISFNNTPDVDELTLQEYLDKIEDEFQEINDEEQKYFEENAKNETKTQNNIKDIQDVESEETDEEVLRYSSENAPVVGDEQVSDEFKANVNQDSATSESNLSADDAKDPETITAQDTESITSIERPTMLEIPTSVSEEGPKREINLIGNPGSTPYNNVYISKELQTATSRKTDKDATSSQDESETSPSVSPTFSEASTEVLTDSTESETEDDDMRTDAIAARQKDAVLKLKEQKDVAPPVADTLSASDLSTEASAANQNPSISIEMDNAGAGDAQAEASVQPINDSNNSAVNNEGNSENSGFWLGKEAPLWIPDSEALSCLHCDARFTVIKRRHHCRACGLVLCSKCCNLKYRLEYLDAEARVCAKCYAILNMDTNSSSGSEASQTNSPNRQPNPNNPMEYCSVVPPLEQVGSVGQNPPTVMVPVGVLKRKGSSKAKTNKSVMFCDGIRPGSDLTKLDTDFNYSGTQNLKGGGVPGASTSTKKQIQVPSKLNRNAPAIDPQTKSFIFSGTDCLPPTVTVFKSDITYIECVNGENMVETLRCEKLTFALQRNLHVHLKIINMDCCINKQAWCFSTDGLISVGQDEIVYVIELMDDEKMVPVDIFHHINSIYNDAVKGTTVTEMGLSLHNNPNFLGFKNHAGFLYIRPTFQCLQNLLRPTEPYLIGLLIHRWETPWAKIFPLRLVLRLGAEYRYYPSPIISTRHRDSVFVEIGHTIINILADFRNFSYTLPNIRGLTIHMEDKNTTVTIPENRYDQVMKSLNNSSDHILAFGGNFSTKADSHLVCVQDTQASSENSYTTHAINILNKPRKVTGASFIVFNGALKSTSGLTAKSSIIEDGLMIQIPPENMVTLRESLRNMKNHTIQCGCVNAPSDETVTIVWGEADANFNVGVTSPIDNQSLSGVPSIRVHNGKDFICNSGNRLIRWTEVFILQNTDEQSKAKDPIDISKISESISKATCQALVKYLDLLTSNNFYKIGIRTTLHVENVSYSAGSNNIKLPPIYMKNLDNELIPILHRITSNNLGENAITLELIFRILNT